MKWSAIGPMTLLSGALLLVSRDVDACGGCFAPPTTVDSTVTGHRMAFAVSDTRTVLWDQFEYNGSPEEFSWVLPIAPGAYIEPSTDAWFEALEGVTKTRVTSPALQCGRDNGGCGFMGSDDSGSSSGDLIGDDGVTVLHRGTVGPYETVTLRSQSGTELNDWLSVNGYAVPPDIEPVIAAYVSEGADFIALKLQPGQGVQQMTPVRVVTPGGNAILPLRMVAAGTGQYVDIVLYVIAEARHGMPDLEESFIPMTELTWDFQSSDSNYLALRSEALEQFLGHTYITTYARRGAFYETAVDSSGFPAGYTVEDGSFVDNFSDYYFEQAFANDGLDSLSCDRGRVRAALEQSELVTEPGSTFTCGTYTDIAAAVIGMHPRNVWGTRLELRLPREALVMDCVVEPSTSQERVENNLLAMRVKNRPSGCPEPVFTSRVARGSARPGVTTYWVLAFVAMGLCVRRLRRRS